MISETILKEYEAKLASGWFQWHGEVKELIAEVRELRESLKRETKLLSDALKDRGRFEKESLWLADHLASIGRCAKRYNFDAECRDDKDCAECWREVAAREVTEKYCALPK